MSTDGHDQPVRSVRPANKPQSESELAAAVVLGIHRLVKQSTLYASDNEAQVRALTMTQQAVAAYGQRIGVNPKIFFTEKSVFIGGRLLRAGRTVYAAALELGNALRPFGIDEVAIGFDVPLDDLRKFQEAVRDAVRRVGPSPAKQQYARIRLRRGNPPGRRPGEEDLPPEKMIVRVYATAVVVMRRFFESLQRGENRLPVGVRRVAQQLADLGAVETPAFLGKMAIHNVRHEHAGRAVNSALVTLGMARQLMSDKRMLARIAMAALLFDIGIPRVAGAGPMGEGRVGMAMPRLGQDQLGELPAGTAGVSWAIGGFGDVAMKHTVLLYEALALTHRREAKPSYGGHRLPTMHARIVATARRFIELLAAPHEERTADQCLCQMLREATDQADRTAIRLLLGALGLFPTGSLVQLSTGEIALVARTASDPIFFAQPLVRPVMDAMGGDLAHAEELDLAQLAATPNAPRIVRVMEIGDGTALTQSSPEPQPPQAEPISAPPPQPLASGPATPPAVQAIAAPPRPAPQPTEADEDALFDRGPFAAAPGATVPAAEGGLDEAIDLGPALAAGATEPEPEALVELPPDVLPPAADDDELVELGPAAAAPAGTLPPVGSPLGLDDDLGDEDEDTAIFAGSQSDKLGSLFFPKSKSAEPPAEGDPGQQPVRRRAAMETEPKPLAELLEGTLDEWQAEADATSPVPAPSRSPAAPAQPVTSATESVDDALAAMAPAHGAARPGAAAPAEPPSAASSAPMAMPPVRRMKRTGEDAAPEPPPAASPAPMAMPPVRRRASGGQQPVASQPRTTPSQAQAAATPTPTSATAAVAEAAIAAEGEWLRAKLAGRSPMAHSKLDKTPLAHLLVYILDQRLTGTTILLTPDRSRHFIFFSDGVPCKVRSSERVAPLDQVLLELGLIDEAAVRQSLLAISKSGQLHGEYLVEQGLLDQPSVLAALSWQLVRKMGHMLMLPPDTAYAHFDGVNLLDEYGGPDLTPAEPLTLVMAGVRLMARHPLVDQTLNRLGQTPLRLAREADVPRLSLKEHERNIVDVLRARPHTLRELLVRNIAQDNVVKLTVYGLVITRCLNLGEKARPPVGHDRPRVVAPKLSRPAPAAAAAAGAPPPTPTPRPAQPATARRVTPPSAAQADAEPAQRPAPEGAGPITAARHVRVVEQAQGPMAGGRSVMTGSTPSPTAGVQRPPPRRGTTTGRGQPRSGEPATRGQPLPRRASQPGEASGASPPAQGQRPEASSPPAAAAAPAPAKGGPRKGPTREEVEQRASAVDELTHYEILGVEATAKPDAIQAAYFKFVKSWHPDRLPPDVQDLKARVAKVFARVNEAYQTLNDPKKRMEYDALVKSGGGTAKDREIVERLVDSALLFQKGEVVFKKGDYAGARNLIKQAVDADPEQPEYRAELAWVEATLLGAPPPLEPGETSDHYKAQIKMLDQVNEEAANFERALFYRAQLLKRSGFVEMALRDFRRVAELNPRNIDAAREVRLHARRQGKGGGGKGGGDKGGKGKGGGGKGGGGKGGGGKGGGGLFGKLFGGKSKDS